MSKIIQTCINCGRSYSPSPDLYMCKHCDDENLPGLPPKGVLKTVYDYDSLKRSKGFDSWRSRSFLDLLPIRSEASIPALGIGNTPMIRTPKNRKANFPFNFYLKDDSRNPTWSFKDRASALVSAYARENGIRTLVCASTGNAGSSLAGICAAQGQRAVVMLPATAPKAKLIQTLMYGAQLIAVDGTYDDAFDLSLKATRAFGWYNRNTAYNPLTIEGKKIVSFEIFDQMGRSVADHIFVPVGDGVILSGLYKGFEDLLMCGIIDRMPKITGVQSEGSRNLAANYGKENFVIIPSNTIADSISVDIPRNFYMASDYIKKYQGDLITVTDEQILDASYLLSRQKGVFAEPAAAASFAGMRRYFAEGKIKDGADVVVLLTGSGLKNTEAVQKHIRFPHPIKPDIKEIEYLFEKYNTDHDHIPAK